MKTALLVSEALAAALALGCGGSGSSSFASGNGPPSHAGSGDDGAPSIDGPDATVSGDDTDAEVFAPSHAGDAGAIVTQSACAPGMYEGKFMTYVGSGGDGGSPGIFSFMWNGDLTIDLSAQKITMTSTTGGEIPTTTSTSTLEISDGGALDGSDQFGGSFFANLSGTLDCAPDAGPPYHLTATLSNGSYRQGTFYTIQITGNLTADYQEAGASSPPMLVNGDILVAGLLMDGGQPFASASGSWSATWVGGP